METVKKTDTKNNIFINSAKFVILSFIGVFMFFIPITIGEINSVPLDHITTYIMMNFTSLVRSYAIIAILIGTIYPFYNKSWNKTKTSILFSFFKIIGAIISILVYFNIGPKVILKPDFGPFLFNSFAVQVGILMPIGSIFLSFLIGYGFVNSIGVLMRPIMRPIWKTPGLSAVNVLASVVGSSVLGLLITSNFYKERKLNAKEACIVATGFSTVAVTFMIIIAKTLHLMEFWNVFLWSAFIVTFVVTAITVRLRPLKIKPETYYLEQEGIKEEKLEGNIFINALKEGVRIAGQAKPIYTIISESVKDALQLVMGFLPNFMSMGLIGLLLAEYTPFFNIFGYIFYPFTFLLKVPEPMLAAKATSLGLAEMYLPALVAASSPLITRFIIGVGCISGVLMFTTTIPGIASTDIPLSIGEMVIIWFERSIFTLIIIAPITHLIFNS